MTATDNYEFNPNAVGNRVARWFDRRATNERALDAMRVDRDRYRLLMNRIEVERAKAVRERDEANLAVTELRLKLYLANQYGDKLEHDVNDADARLLNLRTDIAARLKAKGLGAGDIHRIMCPIDEVLAG